MRCIASISGTIDEPYCRAVVRPLLPEHKMSTFTHLCSTATRVLTKSDSLRVEKARPVWGELRIPAWPGMVCGSACKNASQSRNNGQEFHPSTSNGVACTPYGMTKLQRIWRGKTATSVQIGDRMVLHAISAPEGRQERARLARDAGPQGSARGSFVYGVWETGKTSCCQDALRLGVGAFRA